MDRQPMGTMDHPIGAPPRRGSTQSRVAAADCDESNARLRNISVALRVRPLLESERRSNGLADHRRRDRDRDDDADWSPGEPDACCLRDNRTGDIWHFDSVFGPESSTEELFDVTAFDVINSFCAGYNGTIFAYGQTASGKTYTMHGDGRTTGIVPLAVNQIFTNICSNPEVQYIMKVSHCEIYNEQIFDLLGDGTADIRVLEDQRGGFEIRNLTERRVTTGPEDILSCIAAGDRRRHVGETKMNERSSRSHTILQICLESRHQRDSTVRKSQLNLVDLAGSEGLRHTGATGDRRREGQNINRSLFALSQVIHDLSGNGPPAHG
eukprot:gnl/TRDRNA2_/TRDRNA2_147228_c0_seq2.p1 gnl/TRDRNA2_/TRDRNA2_147228_c0~~gnl/TRDRNA2_/TRDRNA2_147228_c0_seq2.p1  ORF type:complete len:324 (+),score=46.54 gnl/TRDRNA2_/TRDRNA2_147228_c0_seq2:183-1154(+)